WTLVIGSSLFACYFACFFFINNVIYFLANIILGIAFAHKIWQIQVLYTSFSTCQMIFSTRQTLARNSARILGIANLSLISGGILYIYITKTHASSNDVFVSNENYRYYSESETKIMCGFLFSFCMINLVLTCCLPTREIDNSVSKENPHMKLDFCDQLKTTVSTLADPYILMFVPRFINHGLIVSFFMNVYPTSLQYSTILAKRYPMMTAYYAFAMCAGTTLCGFVVAPLNKYFNDFGLRPLYYITAGIQLVTYTVAVLTVPNLSSARPTTESAFFEPNLMWVCLTAILLGFVDSTNAASSSVICSRLLPGRASHTYSAARFYRGVAASTIFFSSPYLTMKSHAIILISVTLISALSFDISVKQIERRELESQSLAKKADQESI
ncbi:hypothetical protein PRIPAC_70618, partial [Pristionchus pacificus]|uniref:Uncharacterized protein n=1 Tax=Pristionchus pacificus TaxID=54126 RepID=A0A2A6CFV5_PRIPA